MVSQPRPSRHCRRVDIAAISSHSKVVESRATWWGYAEADPAVVGVVVAAVVAFALTYVAQRLLRDRTRARPGRRQGPR